MTDARGASGFYGEGRLLALLGRPVASAAALLDAIEAGVLAHAAGSEQTDDITLLAVLKP